MTPADSTPRALLSSIQHALREVVHLARPPRLDVRVLVPAGADPPACADAVSGAIRGHAADLGVPVDPWVAAGTAGPGADGEPAFVFAGCPVRPPDGVADALAARSLQDVWARPADRRWPDALATYCRLILERDPRVLIAAPQRDALVRRAHEARIVDYPDELIGAALQYAVAHGVSVADLGPLAAVLHKQNDMVRTAGELAEVAIDAARPPSIEIRLGEPTLRRVTTRGADPDAFVAMRRRLFTSLGVTFPDIVIVEADVPDGSCALRLNHVCLAPRRLPDDATISDVASFAERALRRHAAWFVALSDVQRTVEDLRLALPELVGIVQERHSYPRLALLTRALVDERVPVRNAARLMVLLLDVPAPGAGRDVVRFAEPLRGTGTGAESGQCPRQLVSYARQEIREEAARLAPGVVTFEAVRVPADLDAALEALPLWDGIVPTGLGHVETARLLKLADQQAHRPRHVLVAATQHSRAVARSLLAGQYPEVDILAADEYPPSYRAVDPVPA